jgi:pimeloyl-ACP methyl ester carboxylesterase
MSAGSTPSFRPATAPRPCSARGSCGYFRQAVPVSTPVTGNADPACAPLDQRLLAGFQGFALDEGESALDITGRFSGSQLAPSLRPVTFCGTDGAPGVELYIDRDVFPHVFAADLPGRTAAAAAAAQRPITAAAFEEKSQAAAWKKIPCSYVIATTDLLIPVGAQRFMAQRARAGTLEVRASHAIATTQPAAVAGQITAAVSAVRKAQPDRHAWP